MKEINKNDKYIVDIIDNGSNGEGIAKIENFTIFINGAIKGEKCEILIVKVLKNYGFGKLINIIEKSNKRADVDCSAYSKCGGCHLRHFKYEDTLLLKQELVQNLFNKGLKKKYNVLPTIGMDNPFYYRNKAQYPVGLNMNNEVSFGVFAERSHRIIDNNGCLIQKKISNEIASSIIKVFRDNNISVYNEEKLDGTLRHINIRTSKDEKEIMVTLVFNEELEKELENRLINSLVNEFKSIKTIVKNINSNNTNVILGEEEHVLYGDGYIEDRLGDYTFRISSKSFYQVNPIQCEKLYSYALENSDLTKDDVFIDLYCGIGTIGIFASKYVKEVVGIEIVEDAVKDAKENSKINNIDNIRFIVGDVEKAFDDLINKEKIKPTVICVDPPRKGLDENTINNIKKIKPEKLTYISCNPATLVRDLKELEDIYEIKLIQPVDMFPYTKHVECCSVLKLR